MHKGGVVGSVIRLIFLIMVVVLVFLIFFVPIWDSYASNDCVIYQSEVISNLKSTIELVKKKGGTAERGFDVAQCVKCMWYEKYSGTLMVNYAIKTSLIGHVESMIVPYNVSARFVNLGCNCDKCDDCANINENRLYHFLINETSVKCTDCPDSTDPCGGATLYEDCNNYKDCYWDHECQEDDTDYSMDAIGNWIDLGGTSWSGFKCVKGYGTSCSSEGECSIYDRSDIEIHLGCQGTRASYEKTCCLPLICEEYIGNNNNCKNNKNFPASSLSCDSDEACNNVCGNTACGYVYDMDTPPNEYFRCYFLPGEPCKYGWQCGSSDKAITFSSSCNPIVNHNICKITAGCSWCGCVRCTETVHGTTHCSCVPSLVSEVACNAIEDTSREWFYWRGCEGEIIDVRIPTTCLGKCCINSGHSCRVGDRDFCDVKYCCSPADIIKNEKCCMDVGRTCSYDWQCCSGFCSSSNCNVDNTPPVYGYNDDDHPATVALGTLVNASVEWSDNGYLKTGIFKHNESGVWASQEISFTDNPEWFNMTILIGHVKGKVCWRQEALDMSDNSMETSLHCFDVT